MTIATPPPRSVSLDEGPEGYRAMNDREAIKVLIKF
jgi:threonine dehydrogenase-like Zn-dependent dehydrogenase